jgi:hypothetical protein
MPAYIYRWPDGDVSVVSAKTRQDAFEILDLIGSVDSDGIKRIRHDAVVVTLKPQDDGTFKMGDCGEWMHETFMDAYPLMDALYERTEGEPSPEELAQVVKQERERLMNDEDEEERVLEEIEALEEEIAEMEDEQ